MPRRVVTLPQGRSGRSAVRFVERARAAGADYVELRNDLHDDNLDAERLAESCALIVSQRGRPIAASWLGAATLVDRELGAAAPLVSFHAPAPLRPADAEAAWEKLPSGVAHLKHVEPLGSFAEADRIFETQGRLIARYGASRVTVLVTGACALPWRARLAAKNALDYCALDGSWAAAPGQRRLDDAIRADCAPAGTARLGILGHGIDGSRSPRMHAQPFDRIDLPPDVAIGELLPRLVKSYRGLAVTSPFKQAVARAIGSAHAAVNTLRVENGAWIGTNTDVEGARALVAAMKVSSLVALGDGGVTAALRETGAKIVPLRHAEIDGVVREPAVWTWPPDVAPPAALAFAGQPVAIVAYATPARRIADEVRRRGGVPFLFGPRWFIAQARGQRQAWGLA